MKLKDTVASIEKIGNVTNEAKFRMKTSQKAFQILSDLYSDKPLAIVRELGCNAYDSMVAAGKGDQPFSIHLPNALEPWLTIQDFGTGISHNDIYEIYTVYFASTKTNTNTQIGCLGLGSKSPFCYSDNFTVTSIVGGEKRIYNAFFNEEATPAIALMSVQETTEGNGVSIQIPVKSENFINFSDSVFKAFRFFDVKPTITGGKIDWKSEAPLFKADDWAFYDKYADRYNGTSYAIMGGVAYPIDYYKIADENCRQLARNGLVIKFGVGELEFTPSRDQLSYTDSTLSALNKKLKKVEREFVSKLAENINEKETLFEAIRGVLFFIDKFHFLNLNRVGNRTQELKIEWKGIDISEPHSFFKKLAPGLQTFYRRQWHRKKVTVSASPDFNESTEWFVDDLERGAERRIRSYVGSTNEKKVMVFTEQDQSRLVEAGFSADKFTKISALPKPTYQKKIRNNTVLQKDKEDITVYRIGEYHLERWENSVIEPSETLPKYYIIKSTDGWKIDLTLEGIKPITSKREIKMALAAFGVSVDDVCMVSSREEKKIIARGGCEKLEDWWKANVDVDSCVDADELATVLEYNAHGYSRIHDIGRFKKYQELPDTNAVKASITKILAMKKKVAKYIDVAGMLKFSKKGKVIDWSLTDAQKLVFKMLCECGYDQEKYLVIAKEL